VPKARLSGIANQRYGHSRHVTEELNEQRDIEYRHEVHDHATEATVASWVSLSRFVVAGSIAGGLVDRAQYKLNEFLVVPCARIVREPEPDQHQRSRGNDRDELPFVPDRVKSVGRQIRRVIGAMEFLWNTQPEMRTELPIGRAWRRCP
jgi:hypothetical protein